MGKKITDKVTWVGKIDWELTEFHGHEYSTEKGSSYNSYLIRDQKTVLMDTVWKPFDEEFVASLKREIDLKDIDYIVMNHNENDHSGALPALMREIPDTPIYCTKKGSHSPGAVPSGLELRYRQDRRHPGSGQQPAGIHRSSHAPLAGYHVHLHDRRKHPVQQ